MHENTSSSSPDPVTGASPLNKEDQSRLLTTIVNRSEKRLLCFDLDSTLINNRPRNAVIMREFAQRSGEKLLSHATQIHFPNWSAYQSMQLLGLPDKNIEQLIEPYLTFWEERFFKGTYCAYDIAIAGAVQFIQDIQAMGGLVYYVTGRDESMREGTLASLEQLGFPIPGSPDSHTVQLLMNPTREGSDDEYKRHIFKEIATSFDVLPAFDNEPAHINAYRKTFTQAFCVHLHTDHSMRDVKLLTGIQSISDFEVNL